MNANNIKKSLRVCLEAQVVPFIQGSPGIGKSAIVRQIADEYGLEMIDHRLSTSDPTDMNGLPSFKDGMATFSPFDIFPVEGTPIPKGKQGWLLFLDEFNSAPRSVVAAAYKLILDRMVGQKKLHKNVAIVCAGNKLTDRAITNDLSTAMSSRLVHLEMEASLDDWMENVAAPQKYDERIIAYLHMSPDKLMNFNPDSEEHTFACPRTWEFVNRILKVQKDTKESLDLIKGTIGPGTAYSFVQFCEVYQDLPDISKLVQGEKDTNATAPSSLPVKWALVTSLANKTTAKNIEAITWYLDRCFEKNFHILYFRMVPTELVVKPCALNMLQRISSYVHNV